MKRLVCTLVTSVMAASMLASCAQSSPTSTTTPSASKPATTQPTPTPTASLTPQYGGTLKLGYATGPGTDIGMPMEAIGVTTRTQQLTMEALFYENLDGSFNPRLATSMDLAPDGSTATIHLRKGVKFQDGTDFNAQAVLWNYNELKSIGALNSVSDTWKSLDVIDDYTFKITYFHWQNIYQRDMSEPTNFMISPTAFQKNGLQWMRNNMVGTGPFMQKSYQQDTEFDAVKNPNYWNTGEPYLDGVSEVYIADPSTRIAAFQSGALDVLQESDPKIIHDLAAQGHPIISTNSGSAVLVPDSANASSPWANLNVRLAVEYAIDKQSIASALGYGYRTPTYQIPTPANAVFNPSLPKRTYDLTKAKQLMSDAGMSNGFDTRLIVAPGTSNDYVLAIQAALKAININATIELPTGSKFADYQTKGWTNGLLVTGMGEWPNYNADWGYWFARNSNWWPSIQKTDQLQALIQTSDDTIKPEVPDEQAVIKYIYDNELVVPTLFNTTAFIEQGSYIHGAGFLTRMFNIHWHPETAWVSAH